MDRHLLPWVRTSCAALFVFVALVAGSPSARADRITDAEDLFRRAKALQAQGRHAEACPMFEESQRLDPQMGTLLNAALCHEQIGRIASAWGEFRAVEQQARAAVPPREDRIKLAKEHAEKLEPRLSRIKIVVPAEARSKGLVVKIDGEVKGEPAWSGVPVDPGTRTIEASAPGKKPATVRVKITEEGVVVPVTVPRLEDAPAPPPRAPAGPSPEELDANRSRKTTGFIVGGLGVATMAGGGVFGVLAIMNDNAAQDACPKPCIENTRAAEDADNSTDRAFLFANVANVAIPLGVLGVAIGAYLIFTAGPTEKTGRPKDVKPSVAVTPNGVGARW